MKRTKSMEKARAAIPFVEEHKGYLEELLGSAEELAGRIPAGRSSFYTSHVLVPILVHKHSLEILGNYSAAMAHRDAAKAELAVKGYDKLIDAMRRAETDKWAAWYFGECLVGIAYNRGYARLLLAELRGEPAPLVRKFEEYPRIYDYQERFLENFPFLYEHTADE